MTENALNQWLKTEICNDDLIQPWMESFIMDRKIQNMSKGTIGFYTSKLKVFIEFCELVDVLYIHQITANVIRQYLVWLESKGHNPGGIHTFYRTLKTFLLWWEEETDQENYKNPIRKVKAPKLAIEPLEPVSIDVIDKMINTCKGNDLKTLRDKAIMLVLLDTGARASELCSISLQDVDVVVGTVLIKQGKGRKPRSVFLGQKTRKVLRAYLKVRNGMDDMQGQDALWVTQSGDRMQYWCLNEIIKRRARMANVEKPELHGFRRAFALNFLRNGGDIYTLQKLMGHADLQVMRRYLAQTTKDLQIAHNKFSPVDNSRL